MAISFDPTIDPVAQGYTADGTTGLGGPSAGTWAIGDQAGTHLYYYRTEAGISGRIRVRCSFVVTPVALENGRNTGVRFVLDAGVGHRRIELRCVLAGTQRKLVFATAAGESNGAPYDWASFGAVEIRRELNGDAVLTIGGVDVDTVPAPNLPDSGRSEPTFEFGCFSDPAQVVTRFGIIEEVAVEEPQPVSFDPTVDPELQGYTADGHTVLGGHSAGLWVVSDQAGERLAYHRPAAGVLDGVRVRCSFGITPVALGNGIDTGVRFVLDAGPGLERIELMSTLSGTQRRLGFALAGGGVSRGAAYDWATFGLVEFRREPNGDAVLTIGGIDVETVTSDNLPSAARPEPTFEFGCYSVPAQVVASFGIIEEVTVPPDAEPTTFVVDAMQIHPRGAEKVQFDAMGGLPTGAGIDPTAEPVTLRLRSAGAEFYPGTRWANPINGFRTGDPMAVDNAEKSRTGIQAFHISRPDPSGNLTVHFVDTKADVPEQDFSSVEVELVIGDDTFSQQVALVLDGKVWRLA